MLVRFRIAKDIKAGKGSQVRKGGLPPPLPSIKQKGGGKPPFLTCDP